MEGAVDKSSKSAIEPGNIGRRAEMAKYWSCAVGHRVEADTEEELVTKIQEHMRREHGMELSRDRILRDLREER